MFGAFRSNGTNTHIFINKYCGKTNNLCRYKGNPHQLHNLISKKKTSLREGYLIKKGKNFGGWKIRYFVLKHGILDSFESKEGELNGSLKLKHCLVNTFPDSSTEEIRHALIITEYKKGTIIQETYPSPPPDSKIISKYILCAENELERNDWIAYMEAHIVKLRLYATPEIISQLGSHSKSMPSEESLSASQNGRIPIVRNINDAFDTPNNGSLEDVSKVLPMPPNSISRVATYKSQNSTDAPSTKAENRTSFGYRSQTVVSSTTKKIVEDTEKVLSKPAALTFVLPREKSIKIVTKGEKNPMRAALGVFKRKNVAGNYA